MMMKNRIKLYQNKFFDDDKIKYGFTGRSGGVSETPFDSLNLAFHVGDDYAKADQNRDLLALEFPFNKKKLTWASQVHGDDIFILDDEKQVGFVGEYDGIITNLKGVPLMTLYADCIPILLFDPVKNVIGSIHAGWKGTFFEIVSKGISLMVSKFASNAEDIQALIGPGICEEHYDVSEDLAIKFQKKFPEVVLKDTYHLDLRKINRKILEKKGLKKIYDMEICTSCKNEVFFSYRKEKGKTGRFAALIMLNEEESK